MTLFSGLTPTETPADSSASPTAEQVLPSSKPFDDVEMSKEEQDRYYSASSVLNDIKSKYQNAKDARTTHENRWLEAYYAWRGEYSPEEKARIAAAKTKNKNASEIFIKLTKTKATAALGQIQEILFNQDKFPIGIEATKEPQRVAKEAFIIPENVPIPEDIYGYSGDGREIAPGETSKTLLGGLYDKYKAITQGKKVINGPSPDPKSFPQINPAEEAALNMERIIFDQFEEGNIRNEIRRAAWECVILGTGCIKGPLTYSQTTHSWVKEGDNIVYKPHVEDIPRSFYVSIWNLYPDPNATTVDNCSYVVEKHLLNRNAVAELKKYADFDKDAIDRVLRTTPRHETESWEQEIRDTNLSAVDERYEVLEYWGYLDKTHLEMLKPKEKELLSTLVDQAQVNVWICNNEILRIVLNPFVPARLPYLIVPYEEHLNQLWGTGLPENMRDPQKLLNGHYRMMVDNLSFAGNVIVEINETALVPGQSPELFPGKVFRKQSGITQNALNAIQIPNVAPAHIQAINTARQFADEATGQPSYSYGQSGVTATTRTAAGMSMLMGAAAGNIKQVVKNFDEHLLKPLGQAYFAWNMQFNKNADVRGDIKIVAKGTAALMQKEVQSQRLLQFLQIVSSNQMLTPFANLDYILKEIAKSLDLDPDKTVNDPTMARLVADIIGAMGAGGQAPQAGAVNGASAPAAEGNMQVSDTSGGGGSQIGIGSAPQAGEQGFTG